MYWKSFADFLAMGGYGLYVWGSFGVTAGVLLGEAITLTQRRRRAIDEIRSWRLLNAPQGQARDPAR
jgi:heme exporter protein D